MREKGYRVWLLWSSLLWASRLPLLELPGIFLRDPGFSNSTPSDGSSLQQLLDQIALAARWPHGLTPTHALIDLRLFKAGDGHEDVVKVSAAPSQDVHPLLASFLPQFIDGIFCARKRERQRDKEVTPSRNTLTPME